MEKTCLCCKSGTFGCEQPVLYPLGRNRLIYVDRCMIPELQSLWKRGIETGGCCCGHFEDDSFIQVFPEHMDAMRELGYEEIPPIEINGTLMGECAFKPKTMFEFNGYGETKTELEQRYARLEKMAIEMYKAIAPMHEHCCEDTCLSLGEMGWGADYCPNTFRDQLEELGVSLDD